MSKDRIYKINVLLISFALVLLGSGCVMSNRAPIRTMSGTVTDVNGVPLQGVMITTEPPSSSVATDALGRYSITAVSEGEFQVKAKKLTYAETAELINVRGFEVTRVDLQMIPEAMIAKEVESTDPFQAEATTDTVSTETTTVAADTETEVIESDDDKWWRK